MKLIIQIPCYNEEKTLPITLNDLPKKIDGIDKIEILVIDDGSKDNTREVAIRHGADHVIGFNKNRGLARAFAYGLETALKLGADIIVNTDADNQYCGADIPKLLEPILKGEADIVIGDRQTHKIPHFSRFKKFLQRFGSMIVSFLSRTKIPDATSGFRAISRDAATELNVISNFSYTIETLIQAGRKRLAVVSVPIRTNDKLRESRLFTNMWTFVKHSAATMIMVFTTYEPLKVFISAAVIVFLPSIFLFLRFLWFYFHGNGSGHVQSLILGLLLFISASFLAVIGVLAELINANRKLIEKLIKQLYK